MSPNIKEGHLDVCGCDLDDYGDSQYFFETVSIFGFSGSLFRACGTKFALYFGNIILRQRHKNIQEWRMA
jgi:hypothetical protein